MQVQDKFIAYFSLFLFLMASVCQGANQFGNAVAIYRFEDNLTDSNATSGNDLADQGAATYSATAKQGSKSYICETADYGLLADSGVSSDFPFKNGTGNTTGSWAGWVQPTTLPGNYQVLWGKGSRQLRLKNTVGTYEFIYYGYDGSSTVYTTALSPAANISTGKWYHVGFSIDGATGNYVLTVWDDTNKARVSTSGNFTPTWTVANVNWTVGSDGSYHYLGLLDELVVWDTALSLADLTNVQEGDYDGGAEPSGSSIIPILGPQLRRRR